MKVFQKGDERILGDGDFVLSVLSGAREAYERKYRLKATGVDINRLSMRITEIFDLTSEQLLAPGKQPKAVEARILLCYWAMTELGISQTALGKQLRLSRPAVSLSVACGRIIALEKNSTDGK